ncbi:keratin, type II cytoskeletal 2 oral-like [Oceanobacillus picturae]|uniref:Keratin, type II cytoskeletal 2 oral-like n=1 Tax=Oceanobacillus picturae TaxID=171693 RepID=A0A0U9HAR1_9BACI|nr:keratin, type II cytoskeletal 2 oral-like [Oceanobacillus picturae]
MDAVLDLIRSVSTVIFFSFKDITEEDIENNLESLKHNEWFQDFLHDEKYNKLILNNTNVRRVIGSIDTNKHITLCHLNRM